MADSKGTRSRDGCFNCRRRKRRCDKQKPICMSCSKKGASCVYPSMANNLKFVVSVSPDSAVSVPLEETVSSAAFFHTTPDDVAAHSEPDSNSPAENQDKDEEVTFIPTPPPDAIVKVAPKPTLTRTVSANGIVCNNPIEMSLIQYYVEVVSTCKVFAHSDKNLFTASVMPRILSTQGPLQSTVLAMSAGEWQHQPVANTRAGFELSAYYKSRALGELQRSLWVGQRAEENLLTCVLLASLDISHGSKATWLRHLHGAFALLEKFSGTIDPAVSKFALKYFRFRYTLLQTTQPRIVPACYSISDSGGNQLQSVSQLFMDDASGVPGKGSPIDEQVGCSAAVAEIIAQTSTLALQANDNIMSREKVQNEAHQLEYRLSALGEATASTDDKYLAHSADSFRYAAHIYILLVCFDMSIRHTAVVELHQTLMSCLSVVIVRGQRRRLFPMWPLFIAGCTCSCDEQRMAVIELFSIVEDQWPVSSVASVWAVLRTIWQARDLSVAGQPTTKRLDWQDIIHRFGWKLALT